MCVHLREKAWWAFVDLERQSLSDPGWAGSGVILSQLRRPEQQVVSEKLHDQSGVLVVLILHTVEVRDRLVEGSASHCTSLLRVLEDFVMEDGVVEGKSKLERVRVA